MEQVIVTAIAGGLALAGTIYGYRSTRRNTELAVKIETNKAQANAQVEVVKAHTETEQKRTDQLLDTQMQFIKDLQAENRAQRQEMLDKDRLHREEMMQVRSEVAEITKLMNNCVEARNAQETVVARLSAEVLDLKQRLAQYPPKTA